MIGTTPPTLPVDTLPDLEPPKTKWPTRLGVISIVYAAGGLLCQLSLVAWVTVIAEAFMKMGGFDDVKIPAATRYPTIAVALFTTLLGVLLLIGGINLLRRRRSGVAELKLWAVLRMLVLLLGTVIWVVTLPANVEFQRQMTELQTRSTTEAGRPDLARKFDEEQQWRTTALIAAVMSVMFSIYPMFLGFYLSRRSIRQEISTWDSDLR